MTPHSVESRWVLEADVRAAVRLVGLLKFESEREYLSDLAADRDRGVRTAVVVAAGRLGGEKAVPVLRKRVRTVGREGPSSAGVNTSLNQTASDRC